MGESAGIGCRFADGTGCGSGHRLLPDDLASRDGCENGVQRASRTRRHGADDGRKSRREACTTLRSVHAAELSAPATVSTGLAAVVEPP